ncbi:BspA family leucine-rich repeat surface protein [Campylobacter coli]|nr:BspA family leucine-rich repeat surface protein [Campylobacter coli]
MNYFLGQKELISKVLALGIPAMLLLLDVVFYNLKDFNEDISKWNTSKLQDAREMFFKCKSFNQNLNSWNVGNVKNTNKMFYECTNFKQILNKWKVDKCENFSAMFLNDKYVEEHFKEFKWNTRNADGYSANPFKA